MSLRDARQMSGSQSRTCDVSKLSDGELSRWIAEKIDPISLHTALGHRDMIHDPAMTVMLLQWMFKIRDFGIMLSFRMVYAQIMAIGKRRGLEFADEKDLGRAVAEAWCLEVLKSERGAEP